MKHYSYLNEKGDFDYERYKKVQTTGNYAKINFQWVTKDSIDHLASYIKRSFTPKYGLCHGTRRGHEQQWFREAIPDLEAWGTEISDTARQFPHTIQWDFHETKPEWIQKIDFIYSNSWDHSYDPFKLFSAWFNCLRVGGLCLLEHTPNQTTANELDPLGLELIEMVGLLNHIGAGKISVVDILEDGPLVGIEGMKHRATHVVARRLFK